MELSKVELQAVELAAATNNKQSEVTELEALELALVGGGNGTVIW